MSFTGSRTKSSGLFSLFFLFFVISAAVVVNIRWIWIYRRDQLLDIDEAGYLTIAMNDYHHLIDNGFDGWWNMVLSPSIQSPLTTALTSLFFWFFDQDVLIGFIVPSLMFFVAIAATYSIANVVGGKYAAIFASILFATAPLAVNYSRSYSFASTGTAVTALAIACLVCWISTRRWYWAIGFGILVGLMPLARTMTIAYVPGLLLGAFIANWAEPDGRGRRYALLIVGLLLGGAVASVWLIPSGAMVSEYLLDFGYGAQAADYGDKVPFLSGLWQTAIEFANEIYLAHFAITVIGLLAATIILVSGLFNRNRRDNLAAYFRSPMFPLVVFVAAAIAAVSSSQNRGTGFLLPILPPLFVIAAWGIVSLGSSRAYRSIATIAVMAVCVYAIVPLLDLRWPRARERTATLPLLGEVILKKGGGTQQRYEAGGRVNTDNPGWQLDPKIAKAWIDVNAATQGKIFNEPGEPYPTAFGFRGYVYNVNSVQLEQMRRSSRGLDLVQIYPATGEDAVDTYRKWLVDGEARRACLLLTAPGADAEIAPYVDTPTLEQAARQAGFAPVENWQMPNGRPVTMWQRPCPAA